MPIYEYRCKDCGKEFEALRKFSDKPLKECIYCKGKVEKLISLSSFHLKGSGWHKTDYAAKGKSETKPEKSECKPTKPECGGCPNAN